MASEFQKLFKTLSAELKASKPEKDSWEYTRRGYFLNRKMAVFTGLLAIASILLSLNALNTDTKIAHMDSLLINQQIEIKKTDSQLTYLIQTDSLLKKQVFLQIGQNYILGNELQEIKKGHDLDYISARNSFQATIGKVGRLLQDLRQRYGGGTDTFKDSSKSIRKT